MTFREAKPGETLRPYIRCFWMIDSEVSVTVDDKIFPSGFMEVVFNLGDSVWKSTHHGVQHTTPGAELMGQITGPLCVSSVGHNIMFGVRFHPHTAAIFLKEDVWELNDRISDATDLMGAGLHDLHGRLAECSGFMTWVALAEKFFLTRLSRNTRPLHTLEMIGQIVGELRRNPLSDSIALIAEHYKITPRYLHTLFLRYVGMSPKAFSRVNRFQLSLHHLCRRQDEPLTDIAYQCGYFDQSHFIKEFRSFTGIAPSACSPIDYPTMMVRCSSYS